MNDGILKVILIRPRPLDDPHTSKYFIDGRENREISDLRRLRDSAILLSHLCSKFQYPKSSYGRFPAADGPVFSVIGDVDERRSVLVVRIRLPTECSLLFLLVE